MERLIINIKKIIVNLSLNNDDNKNKNVINNTKYIIYFVLFIVLFWINRKLMILILVYLILIQLIKSKMSIVKKKSDNLISKNLNKCNKTTINNPMGNSLLYTSINKLNQQLCNNQDKQIDVNLKYNIYYDSKDLFLKNNNTRPFITMPSQMHPNNIDKYKKYIYYLDNPSCKLNQQNCMYNEDIRYHKTNYLTK